MSSAATAVRAPKSVYAARNYATASGNYANFIFDVDGPPHVVSNNAWPARGTEHHRRSGPPGAYANLETAVPSQNLADYATVAGTSGFPANPDKLWDGVTETDEVAATGSEGWVQPRSFVTGRRRSRWPVFVPWAEGGQAEGPSVVSGWRRVPLLRVVRGCRRDG
ncbi:hypothetical protein [Streptomyces sp. AK010]|uniref:hypothetical protein n=1 Tax=Streptomyces sp. AK010 TaxID=2723074 RepID=UPI00160C507E|nr:hypothetical protein [Streptomyces sp. AK010]MBB6421915.1 hypothetical protein [Streptomyces sp. AK010]